MTPAASRWNGDGSRARCLMEMGQTWAKRAAFAASPRIRLIIRGAERSGNSVGSRRRQYLRGSGAQVPEGVDGANRGTQGSPVLHDRNHATEVFIPDETPMYAPSRYATDECERASADVLGE